MPQSERIALTDNQRNYWTPLPLDNFAAPSEAYSLRKLKSTYAGPGIRLRRASDNAETDINFLGYVPGLGAPLDMAQANAHCAATTCFFAKWYDQSGNARDAAQTTAAYQPQYIANCNGTLPCARSAGNDNVGMGSGGSFTAVLVNTFSAVARRNAGIWWCNAIRAYSVGLNTNSITINYNSDAWYVSDGTTNLSSAGNTATATPWAAGVGVINAGQSFIRQNAVEVGPAPVAGDVKTGVVALAGGGVTGDCDYTELVHWGGYALTLAERAALTANQKQFWGLP
jgi:hypothetical protein